MTLRFYSHTPIFAKRITPAAYPATSTTLTACVPASDQAGLPIVSALTRFPCSRIHSQIMHFTARTDNLPDKLDLHRPRLHDVSRDVTALCPAQA